MRTSMLCVSVLVLAMTGAARAQLGLARLALAAGGDRASLRSWKHHLDAGTRRGMEERAALRARTPEGARRITLKSAPGQARPMRATVTDSGAIAVPMLERDPMGGGPAGRGGGKGKSGKKKPR
ncbi:MAG: hypothetical protein JNL50_02740 [Phycisphaerae bacterium]|nr:hypothetical protein [Phycisphaerae bacterium]